MIFLFPFPRMSSPEGAASPIMRAAERSPAISSPWWRSPPPPAPASETTAFSVITDHSRNYKLTVFSYKVIPSYAILDADLITTVPAPTAAACGMDAMADDAMKSGNIAVNPRASAKRDILDLYRKAL